MKVKLTRGGRFEKELCWVRFFLILFAKVIPMLVKNLLNRVAVGLVFLCSEIIELGAEDLALPDVNSFGVFHRPDELFVFC